MLNGLESFAARELAELGEGGGEAFRRSRRDHDRPPDQGFLRFRYGGPWARLLGLRTVVAVHAVVAGGLPRPSALLDDGTIKRVVARIDHIRSLHPSGSFGSFRLSAAGADSPTFRRVRERLARATGLRDVSEGGELLLRFKRAPIGFGDAVGAGAASSAPTMGPPRAFELTARLSPRPLSTRAWRVCNLPGALNATVGSVMAGLSRPAAGDVYLNLACGSATLLIERAALGPARRLVGCDVDARALACAAENVAAAGVGVELQPWDAGAVPLPDGSVSALVADLPFGQLSGSHAANEQLYPAILAEAARLAAPGARFVVVTQQVNLFERSLRAAPDAWTVEQQIRLHLPANAGALKPRIIVLRRGG